MPFPFPLRLSFLISLQLFTAYRTLDSIKGQTDTYFLAPCSCRAYYAQIPNACHGKANIFFRIKKKKDGEKSFEEEKDSYALSWRSRKKMMHSIIQIENGTYKINRTKFSTFPALIESYMRKSEDDAYCLTVELRNLKIDKASEVRDSHRDRPESLSWYHGTVGNKVLFLSICLSLSIHVIIKENQ